MGNFCENFVDDMIELLTEKYLDCNDIFVLKCTSNICNLKFGFEKNMQERTKINYYRKIINSGDYNLLKFFVISCNKFNLFEHVIIHHQSEYFYNNNTIEDNLIMANHIKNNTDPCYHAYNKWTAATCTNQNLVPYGKLKCIVNDILVDGDLQMFKHIKYYELGSNDINDDVAVLIKHGHQNILNQMYVNYNDRSYPLPSESNLSNIAKNGWLEMIINLHKSNIILSPNPTNICNYAALGGHLNIIKWYRETFYFLDSYIYIYAIRGNQIHVLQWLFENNCPRNNNLCIWATKNNNLSILKWLREKFFHIDVASCHKTASENNYFEIMEWLTLSQN